MNRPGLPAAIVARGLRKSYGTVDAVAGLDLRVESGEMFGFLGPNGAGKSTSISMLCTLLPPSGGTAEVAGADIVSAPHEVRRKVGVVFQESIVDGDLTAEENLRFHGELYGVPRRQLRPRVGHLLELMGLGDRRHDPVATFSGGMRRRLEIARGLTHGPEVLFLDEPTAGLDPQSRAAMWGYLRQMREQQALTLFVTTHYLEEAEHCDRLVVIDHGRVVAEGTPQNLKSGVGSDVVHMRTDDDSGAAQAVRRRLGLDATTGPDGIRITTAEGAALVPRLCALAGTRVHAVTVTRPSLDDVFLHYTGRTIREADA